MLDYRFKRSFPYSDFIYIRLLSKGALPSKLEVGISAQVNLDILMESAVAKFNLNGLNTILLIMDAILKDI